MVNLKKICGQTNGQTDKRTSQKLSAPDLAMWGNKTCDIRYGNRSHEHARSFYPGF